MVKVEFNYDGNVSTYECEACVCSLQGIADGEHDGKTVAVVLGKGSRYEILIKSIDTLWHIVEDTIEEETARMIMGALMIKALKDLMKGEM